MRDAHLSDQTLLLAADGELSARKVAQVGEHLAACWVCRARKQELEAAVGDFVRVYRRGADRGFPSAAGPRALLAAQMNAWSRRQSSGWLSRWGLFGRPASVAVLTGAAALVLCVVAIFFLRTESKHVALMLPDHSLTPGATVLMGRDEICRADGTGNKAVPVALQREVFRKYRIRSAAREYEVDYLITPALGGAEDIHNLWPESYRSTVWNARVKDQLEDYLRDRVCAGTLDLSTAQNALAVNWIDAYKRYFHTDGPLTEAR